ncbi:MAG: alpha-amylase family glycosyl hydrolase [Clostridiales bacterium]|nr:alpha-amylase family glycosyl hydrolase [Clostridiales bacterium]
MPSKAPETPIPAFKILEYDPYLAPFAKDIARRMAHYLDKKARLLKDGQSLADFANGHLYYGFHRTEDGWVYREWAPNAEALFLFGEFNGWDTSSHPMEKLDHGNFAIYLPGADALWHGMQVKVHVQTKQESFDRIPLYIKRAVQREDHSFNGEIWEPDKPFPWTDHGWGDRASQKNRHAALFIYECHVGISSEEYGVASFRYFTENILPRIARGGYTAIQLMAVVEHPYYGSFGYQVSNFFAVSSRFGTPDDLKGLIDVAHGLGISVFLDLVHSHAAANVLEGIAGFDGTAYQFFHAGVRGNHPVWKTKLFNYAKQEVIHFLLSNIKFWLEEYHFDGFRFDGVTSMLYHNHGMTVFNTYAMYFSANTDPDAIAYLQLAADLCREVNPNCVLIAEDMSGMPGMCLPIAEGGIGFDYRLSMGMPDYWVKTIKEKRDEDWDLGQLWHELTTRRPMEKVIGYCESHDQALVGDKTIMFWLADKEMYWRMGKSEHSVIIDRAVALHKMIRLITCACAGDGYLNFMGNEFGHPEWIDFPRESNGWSYHYARRLWGLANDENLRYSCLLAFDQAMISLVKDNDILQYPTRLYLHNQSAKILLFFKGEYLFAFNFHPGKTYYASIQLDHPADCSLVLHTNWASFGGHMEDGGGDGLEYKKAGTKSPLHMVVPSRSAKVYKLDFTQ